MRDEAPRAARRLPTLLLACVAAACAAACEELAEGERAYDVGRFDDAHATFSRAEESDPDGASAELLYNRALAALRADEPGDARAAAERAGARAGPEVVPLCDFLRGNAEFARCETAELQASTPEAEPFAFDVAIGYADKARLAWLRAATSRPDWPEARRNVERALLKRRELERKKAEKIAPPRSDPTPRPKILPRPTPEDAGDPSEQETEAEPHLAELPPDQVRELLEKLASKEREKIALRRSHRRLRMVEVEKDW